MTTTLHYGSHTAYVDVLHGCGLLVLPNPAADVLDPIYPGYSVQAADWEAAARGLLSHGFTILGDDTHPVDTDTPLIYGHTNDGREVVSLYGYAPVHDSDSEEVQTSYDELAKVVGVVRA